MDVNNMMQDPTLLHNQERYQFNYEYDAIHNDPGTSHQEQPNDGNDQIPLEYHNLDTMPPAQTELQNTEREELISLLRSWNMECLLDHFLAESVFVNVLKVIRRHHIEKLLKHVNIGIQILFEHNLREWRKSIKGIPLTDDNIQNDHLTTSFSNPPSPVPSNVSVTSSVSRYTPYLKSPTPDEGCLVTLSNVLNETSRGIMLVEYYKKFFKFEEEQRSSLVTIIAQFFDEKTLPLSLITSYRLEREILERFPTEKLEFYRTGKHGKIYNKYSNLKSSFKSAVSQHVLTKTTKIQEVSKKTCFYEKTFVPEDDAEVCLRALKFDNLTSEQFDNCWRACGQSRLSDIKNSSNTADILKKWPFYQRPSGFRLIDMDFNILSENGSALLSKWESYFYKIASFLTKENHIKDKSIKGVLEKVKIVENCNENSRDAVILWSLHGFLVPILIK